MEELLDVLRDYFGESVYEAMLGYCDTAYVTKLDEDYMADAYFPDLSKIPNWEMVSELEEKICKNTRYTFQLWMRK